MASPEADSVLERLAVNEKERTLAASALSTVSERGLAR